MKPRDRKDDSAYIDLDGYGPSGRSRWLDVDWSRFRHSAVIDDRVVNYVDYGDPAKPAIVLIHGLAGNWQNWLENIPALGDDFRTIALDLPGFGLSEMPREPISIHGFANTVVGLLDHLGIAQASLVGNSMGGQTSVQTALDHPERVTKIVLVSPAGYSTSALPAVLRSASVAVGPIVLALAPFGVRAARRPRLRKLALTGIAAHGDRLSPQLALEIFSGAGRPGFDASLQAILAHDFRPHLGDVKAPALVIWGRKDGLVGSGDAHRFAAKIPGARKVIANDTAHVAMMERPDWFNRTVRDFLLDT